MGWSKVYVAGDRGKAPGRRRGQAGSSRLAAAAAATISPAALEQRPARPRARRVVDLAPSLAYEAGHIPGAWFAIAGAAPSPAWRKVPAAPRWSTSPDGCAGPSCQGACRPASARCRARIVHVLGGGTAAWRKPGCRSPRSRSGQPTSPTIAGADYGLCRRGAARALSARRSTLVTWIEREGDIDFRAGVT